MNQFGVLYHTVTLWGPIVSKVAPLAPDMVLKLNRGGPDGDWALIGSPWHYGKAQLATGGLICRYTKTIQYGDSLTGKRSSLGPLSNLNAMQWVHWHPMHSTGHITGSSAPLLSCDPEFLQQPSSSQWATWWEAPNITKYSVMSIICSPCTLQKTARVLSLELRNA